MIGAVFVILLGLGAIAAGAGYVRVAWAMRGFRPTAGRVLGRDVAAVSADRTQGRWGRGGGYEPAITYLYGFDGREFTGDRVSYAKRGLKLAIARERAAAYPDDVVVWVDPSDPGTAYLERHSPGLGWALVAGGAVAVLGGVIAAVAA